MTADEPVGIIGGGLGSFEPGEWTDDTAMAITIAEIATTGADLRCEEPQDYIVERREWWSRTPKDIGNHTSLVQC
jgi:ADP-ribosylglycohydrolase